MPRWNIVKRTRKRSSKWDNKLSWKRPSCAGVTSAWMLHRSTRWRCQYLIISIAGYAESTTRTINSILSRRSTRANSTFTRTSTTLLTGNSKTSIFEPPQKNGRLAPNERKKWMMRLISYAASNTWRKRVALQSKMPLSQTFALQVQPPHISCWVSLTLSIRGSRPLSTSEDVLTKRTTTLSKKIQLMTRKTKISSFPRRIRKWKNKKRHLRKRSRESCNNMSLLQMTMYPNSSKTLLRNRGKTQSKRTRSWHAQRNSTNLTSMNHCKLN